MPLFQLASPPPYSPQGGLPSSLSAQTPPLRSPLAEAPLCPALPTTGPSVSSSEHLWERMVVLSMGLCTQRQALCRQGPQAGPRSWLTRAPHGPWPTLGRPSLSTRECLHCSRRAGQSCLSADSARPGPSATCSGLLPPICDGRWRHPLVRALEACTFRPRSAPGYDLMA